MYKYNKYSKLYVSKKCPSWWNFSKCNYTKFNKLWFRTDDIFTIEEAQKQLGKEEKNKISKSISENAKSTNFSYITNSLNSHESSLSETYNTYTQNDYIYDTNFFTQNLETFHCLAFLSNGTSILPPCKIKTFPYFLQN